MKYKKSITTVAFLLLGLGSLLAQKNPTSSGGEATGSGGRANFSVGQVVYTSATGTNGSVAQGVQQPFEISTTLGVEDTSIQLEMKVYPNPTTNYLNFRSENFENLSFQLIDLNGKLVKNKKVTGMNTTITMETLPKAIYFLNVVRNNKLVKTFKVIKH